MQLVSKGLWGSRTVEVHEASCSKHLWADLATLLPGEFFTRREVVAAIWGKDAADLAEYRKRTSFMPCTAGLEEST